MRTLTFLLSLSLALSAQIDNGKPNIVVFLVDDMGWQDTSVPFHTERTPFNDLYHTPSMERMASRGVRFTQAYSAAVCSPTRVAIMTGQNPARHRVTNWTLRPNQDSSGKTERLGPPKGWRMEGLQPGVPILPELLRSVGYVTIHAGKAHWGAQGTPGSDPKKLGFDVNIAGHCAGAPASYQGLQSFAKPKKSTWDVPGLSRFKGKDIHLTEATTIAAMDAVRKAVQRKRPFYLYLAHYAVHTPLQPHRPYIDRYKRLGLDPAEARYASMIEGMDASLGQVFNTLEALGVAEETLIVFASDNGGLSAVARGKTPIGTGRDTHNAPLRAGKGSAYEGGTRTPFMVSWARPVEGHALQSTIPVAQNASNATPIMIEDLFPTVLSWADVDAPDGDGRDLTGFLASEGTDEDMRRPLLFHYPHKWGPKGYMPHSSLRIGDWKMIYFYEDRRWELYNLKDDLSEKVNLATAERSQLERMAKQLIQKLKDRDALYPTVLETGESEPPVWAQ